MTAPTAHTTPRSDPQNRADLCAFLAALGHDAFDGSFFELRARHGESMRPRFTAIEFPDQAASAILRLGRERDVYLGVAPRARRQGGRHAIPYLTTLWVDADTPQALDRLNTFKPAPSMLIASGRGQHAYWLLEHPVDLDTGEQANQRLAHHLGADPNCWDAARILRPPHTSNYRHQPPRPVELLRLRGQERHALETIIAQLLELPGNVEAAAGRPRERAARAAGGDPLLQIAPARYVSVLLGVQVGRERKIACPFHPDKHPSLHVYPNAQQGWHCFSCRRGGSIYDLASQLWDIPARGSAFLQLRDMLTQELLARAS